MKKRSIAILCILLVIGSSGATLLISSLVQLNLGDKVLLSLDTYNYYQQLEEEYGKAAELKQFIDTNYYKDTKDITFEDGILKGMFESLKDPYSVYMNEKDFKSFSETTTGEYGGIGLHLWVDKKDYITVVAAMEGTPAERAGILSGDIILRVGDLDVGAKNYDEAVNHMRGEPGTDVVLIIKREGIQELITKKMTREVIKVKSVKTEVLADSVGYLKLNSFDEDCSIEFNEQLSDLKNKGIKALILDLRQNGGGSLYECNEIADTLLGKQTIVYTQDKKGEKEYYYSDAKKLNLPLIVLVDGGSASASEILTGAIKDTKSGTIVGEKTFGKGIVQSVIELKDKSAVKLTTSQYFTPNGTNIHGKGIEPDVVVKAAEVKDQKPSQKVDPVNDPQLKKAFELAKEKIK